MPLSALLILSVQAGPEAAAPDVETIVSRSVANNQANWTAAPRFNFTEHDVATKSGEESSRTYEVLMIDGAPYQKVLAVDGRKMNADELKHEDREMQREIEKRRESRAFRNRRIEEYERSRHQDHALMHEMIKGYTFKLAGKETVDGRECFRVNASPRPSYVPPNRETKVLTGMRGTLWIDTGTYQWVKVTAHVFRPVTFGLFIAHVRPGTEFTLEQAPVEKNIWLPTHFEMRVNARIMWWSHNSIDDETYSDYKPAQHSDTSGQ